MFLSNSPDSKRKTLTAILLATLLTSVMIGLQPVNFASAQSDALAEPPAITIVSPENKTYNTNDIMLSFNAGVGKALTYGVIYVGLSEVYYKGDWQQNEVVVFKRDPSHVERTLVLSHNLSGLPEGNHNILCYVREAVLIVDFTTVYYESVLSVNFTVDTVPPVVSVLSPESGVYNGYDAPLDFTVDERFSQLAYSLDGSDNVTAAGNVTLTGLSWGEHTVLVYAWDEAGNVGASETLVFTVFPTTLIAVAIVVIVAVGGIGVLFYFKKRKP